MRAEASALSARVGFFEPTGFWLAHAENGGVSVCRSQFPLVAEGKNPFDGPTRGHLPSTGAKSLSVRENRHHAGEGRMQAKTVSVTRNRHQEIRKLVDRLERGWAWFEANPGHPEFEAREERWIAWLREYEAAYDEAVGR